MRLVHGTLCFWECRSALCDIYLIWTGCMPWTIIRNVPNTLLVITTYFCLITLNLHHGTNMIWNNIRHDPCIWLLLSTYGESTDVSHQLKTVVSIMVFIHIQPPCMIGWWEWMIRHSIYESVETHGPLVFINISSKMFYSSLAYLHLTD